MVMWMELVNLLLFLRMLLVDLLELVLELPIIVRMTMKWIFAV